MPRENKAPSSFPNYRHHTGKLTTSYIADTLKRTKARYDRRKGLVKSAHTLASITGDTLFLLHRTTTGDQCVWSSSDDLVTQFASGELKPVGDIKKMDNAAKMLLTLKIPDKFDDASLSSMPVSDTCPSSHYDVPETVSTNDNPTQPVVENDEFVSMAATIKEEVDVAVDTSRVTISFEELISMKDAEIKKLEEKILQLETTVTELEHMLTNEKKGYSPNIITTAADSVHEDNYYSAEECGSRGANNASFLKPVVMESESSHIIFDESATKMMEVKEKLVEVKTEFVALTEVDPVAGIAKEKGVEPSQPSVSVKMTPEHKCEKCGKGFKSARILQLHMKIHSTVKPHVCELCGHGFNQKGTLKAHLAFHEKKAQEAGATFPCLKCGKVFLKKRSLKLHQMAHAERPFMCELCGKSFARQNHFAQHLVSHEKKYECNVCNKLLVSEKNLKIHKLCHTSKSKRLFMCEICGKSYEFHRSLQHHMLTHSEKPHKCNLCSFSTCYPENLDKHMFRHTGERSHFCDICGKGFIRKTQLNTHMKTHLGEPQYTCSLCGMKTDSKAVMFKHRIHFHGIEAKHKCSYCFKVFRDREKLRIHACKVSDEKPERRFHCDLCEKTFTTKEVLKKHQVVHTGEQPYSCDICGMRFSWISRWQHHMKKAHIF